MNIFVFGSNEKGFHGAGSAREALRNHGAIYGQGVGRQGNSYAIPTKKTPYETLTIDEITVYVNEFIKYATNNPDLTFTVVKIGCGLAGYSEREMAPLFHNCPKNVHLPHDWH